MVYEAAAAAALRGQSQQRGGEEKKGGSEARPPGRQSPPQQVARKVTAVRCGVLRIVRRVFPVSAAGASGSGKN
jgi:hypothetical protein